MFLSYLEENHLLLLAYLGYLKNLYISDRSFNRGLIPFSGLKNIYFTVSLTKEVNFNRLSVPFY